MPDHAHRIDDDFPEHPGATEPMPYSTDHFFRARSPLSRTAGGALVSVALLGACSSSEPDAATPAGGTENPAATDAPPRIERSGPRLQVRGYEADGILVIDGFFDTKLGIRCAPGLASDGVERCLPREVIPAGPSADAGDGGPDYADAACSTPLVTVWKKTCADPARVLVRPSRAAGNKPAGKGYWRIGAPVTPATIYPATFGTCRESAPAEDYAYYGLGTEIAPSELVAFTRSEIAVSPALRAVVFEGEDGSRLQADNTFIDTARNAPCEIALAEDGVSRCTPLAASGVLHRSYADAGCRVPAAIGGRDACTPARACDSTTVGETLNDDPFNACSLTRRRFFTAGPAVAIPYLGEPQMCVASPQTIPFIAVGAPIPPATFPATVAGAKPARTRLVERVVFVGDAPVKQTAVFDPQINDECSFGRTVDGKVRCLPSHAAKQSLLFGDATCTTPLLYKPTCDDSTTFGRVEEGSVCDPVVHMHALVPVTKVFDNRYGTCDEVAGATGFIAGAEIPATTFVEATEHSF